MWDPIIAHGQSIRLNVADLLDAWVGCTKDGLCIELAKVLTHTIAPDPEPEVISPSALVHICRELVEFDHPEGIEEDWARERLAEANASKEYADMEFGELRRQHAGTCKALGFKHWVKFVQIVSSLMRVDQ